MQTLEHFENSFMVLTVVTECDMLFKCWMENDLNSTMEKSVSVNLNLTTYNVCFSNKAILSRNQV